MDEDEKNQADYEEALAEQRRHFAKLIMENVKEKQES